MTTALLTMTGIRKRFGATVALDGVDFAVRPGEVVALFGENGAGKSTLMKVMAGAVEPSAGAMTLRDAAYRPTGPLDARRQGVAMIYQELSLAPHLSVAANVTLGVERCRLGVVRRREERQLVRDALARLGHGDIPPDAAVGSLTVARQQIVEVARAVALDAPVIVFDEPTSSLGRADVERLFALIRRLREAGRAIVYISHFLEEVRAIADRVVVLRDGQTVGEAAIDDADEDWIVSRMVGRRVEAMYPERDRTPGEVVMRVDRLAGAWRPVDASLELRRGEVLGIAGLVGAGRTETLRAVFGLDPRRGGRVTVDGRPVRPKPRTMLRRGVGLLSEDRKGEGLALTMSIADNVTLASLGLFVSPARQAAQATRWIKRVPIRCAGPTQPVAALSGGNQQKVAIARLLETGADVLLLDEPTRGIDVAAKAQVYGLIADAAAGGKAVIMVSSYLPELMGVCDRIAVMSRGRLGEARPVGQWTDHAIMLEAAGGRATDEAA